MIACAKWLGRDHSTCTRKPDGCVCEQNEGNMEKESLELRRLRNDVQELKNAVMIIAYPRRGTWEETATIYELAKYLQDKFSIEYLEVSGEFDKMVKKGTETWKDIPNNFVDDLRGGEE